MIPGDHKQMCKFTSAKDSGYILVLGVLQDWASKCQSSKGLEDLEFVSSYGIMSILVAAAHVNQWIKRSENKINVSNSGENKGSMVGQQSFNENASQNFGR